MTKKKRIKPEVALRSLHNIRLANLLGLVGEDKRFASQDALAAALLLTDGSHISQMKGSKPRRRFTETLARNWEYKLGLPTGSLDVE